MSFFNAFDVPLGPQTYAEPFAADTFLKMPANALVNVGYVVVGAWWLLRSARLRGRADHAYFVAFAALAVAYGPVQFARIVTQERWAGVLDQWITLPFFALAAAWALGLRAKAAALIVSGSLASYLLAGSLPHGFEVVLAVHIVLVLAVTVPVLIRAPAEARLPFVCAVIACAMFVALKKADFALAELGLTRLTGHFWSKVGDFLQIHFTALFFLRARRGGLSG